MKNEWNDINAFMADNFNEFKPFAYFDKHMDCIRVKFLDCSVTEVRLNRIFTVLKPNHREFEGNAGFTIKGVAYLMKQFGLPREGAYHVADILDMIVKFFPDEVSKKVKADFEKNEASTGLPEVELTMSAATT